jgi:hypothetical protein
MSPFLAPTLDRIAQYSHLYPQVRKDQISPGDWIVIRTVKSVYTLRALGNGLYEARGGWFDKKGHAPMTIGVSGATWGGSAILPKVLAACGLRVEFRNRLITSPVKKIEVWPGRVMN